MFSILKRILPLLGLLLFALPTYSQTFIQASTLGGGSSPVSAGAITVTGGNTLISVVQCYATSCTVTLAGNSNTYNQVASCTNVNGSTNSVYVFEADSATAGSTTVIATSAGQSLDIVTSEYSGLATSAFDKQACYSSNLTTANTATLSQANELVVGWAANNVATPLAGSGFNNRRTTQGAAWTDIYEDMNVSSTAAVAATFTTNGGPRGMICATFKASGGGGGSAASKMAGPSKISGPTKTD